MSVALQLTESREILESAPTIPVRLSHKAMLHIAAGVNPIMNATAKWRFGLTKSGERIRTTEIPGAEPTIFDSKTFDLIVGLWGQLRPIYKRERSQSKYRLHLNVVELAICVYAARFASRISRRDTAQRNSRAETHAAVLLRSLENYRKCCKRTTIRTCGSDAYKSLQSEWSDLRNALHAELYPLRITWIATRKFRLDRRKTLEECISAARRGLASNGWPEPPAGELRKLTRMAIREVHRHRTDFSMKTIRQNPELAERYFSDFVARRWSKWEGLLEEDKNG
jgi:hypothetical protein